MFCTNRWRGHRQVFNRNCAPGWNKTGFKPVSLSASFFNERCKKNGYGFSLYMPLLRICPSIAIQVSQSLLNPGFSKNGAGREDVYVL